MRLRGYRREWLVLALVALGTLPLVSVVGAQDTSRLSLTQSIAKRGSVNIDPYWQLTFDRAFARGHWYSDKAPAVALLSLPAYGAIEAVSPSRMARSTSCSGCTNVLKSIPCFWASCS